MEKIILESWIEKDKGIIASIKKKGLPESRIITYRALAITKEGFQELRIQDKRGLIMAHFDKEIY